MRPGPLSLLPLLAAVSLAGCDSGTTASTPAGSDSEAAEIKYTFESKNIPPQDNFFRIALLTNPPDIDPILVSDTTSDGVANKIFSTLVSYDRELNLVPELIEAMPRVSEDRRTYTFTLRRGVQFHHGRELKAEDVKYSLTRLAEVRSKRSNLIEPIEGAAAAIKAAQESQPIELTGVRVVSDYVFEIELEKPYYPFLFHLAMVNTAVVPREVVEEKGDRFSREPVGSGPFAFVEWQENNFLRLERFDDYFKGAPKLAGILHRIIPEPLARQEEYKAGNLDILDVTQGMYQKWKHSNHAEDVLEWPQLTVEYYGFNLEKEGSPFARDQGERGRKLRLAMNYAVDREHIGNNILEGRRFPTNGVIPRGMPGHNAERPVFEQDLDKARQLLEEAGYPDGEGLPEIDLWFNQQGDNAKIAQSVQYDLQQVGINIRLKQLDWAAFIDAADAGEPAFFRLGWVADYPDPENFLKFLFHSENKGPEGNVTFFDNPEVDRLIDQSYDEVDPEKRLELLMEAEDKIIEECPWLFLTLQKEVVLLKPYVKNFIPTAMDDEINASQIEWHLVEMARPES